MSKSARRNLHFTSLDDAVIDARMLLKSGYTQAGNWNLAQVLGHCNDWLRFPVDGYPQTPLPIRFALWTAKCTIGRSMRTKILLAGRMKAGKPTLPITVKPASFSDDTRMVEELADQVLRFEQWNGQLHESPLFGRMTKEEHRRLQIIHLQHHLSFLVPSSNEG